MRLGSPIRRDNRRAEPLLPMIDVVFFLIVFFMIASRFAEPEPFSVARPVAGAEAEVAGEAALYVSAEGVVALRDGDGVAEGDAAVALLAARCAGGGCGPVLIHADESAPAAVVVMNVRLETSVMGSSSPDSTAVFAREAPWPVRAGR